MTYKFKQWMTAATSHDQDLLAAELNVTRAALYQISGGNRNVSAARAQEMAVAIAKVPAPHLPDVRQTDLCQACAQCPYAQTLMGKDEALRGWPQ